MIAFNSSTDSSTRTWDCGSSIPKMSVTKMTGCCLSPPFEDIWSVRVNNTYRAIGRWRGDVIVWFFIGSHANYEKAIARM